MNKETNAQNDAKKKDPAAAHKNAGQKKDKNKPGDAAYNALQQKNDRLRPGRHAGESEMNDENRSGGSSL